MKQRCPASPAPINDGEQVVRGIYSPDIFENGEITVAAVKIDELMPPKGHNDCCGGSSGVSVFRIDYEGGSKQAQTELQAIVNHPKKDGIPRSAVGFAEIIVSDLVAIESGAFLLLDDGCECLRCHSVIRSARAKTKSELRGARDLLVKRLNEKLKMFDVT